MYSIYLYQLNFFEAFGLYEHFYRNCLRLETISLYSLNDKNFVLIEFVFEIFNFKWQSLKFIG